MFRSNFTKKYLIDLEYFRKSLRLFKAEMESHTNGQSNFDSLRANFRANCLLTYLVSVMGEQVRVDDENDAAVSGEFMLGSDLQYLLRFCLSAHLEGLRAEGILCIYVILLPFCFSLSEV